MSAPYPGRPADRRGQRGAAHEKPVPEDTISATQAEGDGQPGKTVVRPGDRIFRGLTTGSGVLIVAIIGLIGLFLVVQAIPALTGDHSNFLFSRTFDTSNPNALHFGILDLLLVTVYISVFALIIAMPVSLGIALFLTQYAPRRLARPAAYLVDLLAAVPSIIFGLWGLLILVPVLSPIAHWIQDTLGFIPIFAPGNVSSDIGGTIFVGAIVLAVMLLPIITAITREVFERTPVMQVEGALALGATKWEVIRTTVLPFGRSGFISASMLGLGRALGETIALMIVLSATDKAFSGSLFDGGATFASKIALAAAEFNNPKSAGAFIAAGLVLFVLTFVVNAIGRSIAAGKRGAE